MMAVGAEADPAIADFVHDLFAATPPVEAAAAVGQRARQRMGPTTSTCPGLTVPTLVISGTRTSCYRCCQARKIARRGAQPCSRAGGDAGRALRAAGTPRAVSHHLRALVSAVLSGSIALRVCPLSGDR